MSSTPQYQIPKVFAEILVTTWRAGEVFKARAFRNASKAMQECTQTITSEAQAKKLKIPGIGKGSLAVVS